MTTLKQKLTSTLKSYRSNESGQFAIYTAVGFVAILAGLAAAVDLSSGMSEKQTLQDTTDAIALMAVKNNVRSQSELNAVARTYLEQHYGAASDSIVINSITRNGDVVTVDATNPVKTYLSGVFGSPTLNVRVASTATYSVQNIEIALVLDTTGSMSGTKMTTLKRAATDLTNTMQSTNNPNLKMSVVPFANYANVGTANQNAAWVDLSRVPAGTWNGCMGSRLGNRDEDAAFSGSPIPGVQTNRGGDSSIRCGSEILPLTNDFGRIRSKVNSFNASGWTYIPSGLAWGWRTLTPDAPYTEAAGNALKIMVVMTDGANTRSKNGEYHDVRSGNAANSKTDRLCAAAKRDDIRIITIAYEISDTSTINLMRNCATTNSDFYDARNSSDLENAFREIGQNLSALRITS